jgi:hypothetical protein
MSLAASADQTLEPLKAPFPWFGGKRRVADVVWRAFGDVPNYVEPFAGSLAVLLGRPHAAKIETVNDADCYVANLWRAVTLAPEEVAHWADWPVNEVDLHARHRWLVGRTEFREKLRADPDYYDAKIAGWWVWGICQWIGNGWCVEPNNHKHPRLDGIGKGVHADRGHVPSNKLPKLAVTHGAAGVGIHASERAKRASPRIGVNWDVRPGLDGKTAGRGIHADSVHLPSLGNDRGLNGVSAPPCTEWFLGLQARLRRVRVACGDWTRVLGPSVLGKGKNVGGRRPCAVFLDPPYSHEFRDAYLYAEDDAHISDRVREWALEHGPDPDLRIALCGYEGEHEMPGWTKHAWKAARGYAGESNENRQLERIWFSPHCLPIADAQASLFGSTA